MIALDSNDYATNDTTIRQQCIDSILSLQHDNGTFASGGSECSESCAWVIVATTTWGINPDADSRFIKNGNSVMDALLTHYII